MEWTRPIATDKTSVGKSVLLLPTERGRRRFDGTLLLGLLNFRAKFPLLRLFHICLLFYVIITTKTNGPVVANWVLRHWKAGGQGFDPCLQHLLFSYFLSGNSVRVQARRPPYTFTINHARWLDGHPLKAHHEPSQARGIGSKKSAWIIISWALNLISTPPKNVVSGPSLILSFLYFI